MSQSHPLSSSDKTKKHAPESPPRTKPPAASELAHGQIVIVWARWILVAAGLLLTLWNPGELSDLRLQVIVILLLALVNFYLHAHILMQKPISEYVIYGTSAFDFIVITLLVWTLGGFDSHVYVFYFPAILAMSVAFDTAMTIGFMGGIGATYTLISLSDFTFTEGDFQILIARLLMMVAIAFCGNLYWHIERNRREAAQRARQELMAEVRRGQVGATE